MSRQKVLMQEMVTGYGIQSRPKEEIQSTYGYVQMYTAKTFEFQKKNLI
jgi:hypothetical protein